ncbi:MAG: hypothetical protein HY660_04350, partial [Armatimonadetes bacterium]|nr:hypothetical protein [Armatimonadota bacterium]
MGRTMVVNRKVVAILVVLGLAAGIGAGAPGRTAAQTPDVVVVAQTQDMQTGDPHKSTLTHATNAYANIYETLMVRDAALNLKPGLALSW